VRLHEDMPEFTFQRIFGEYSHDNDTYTERAVTIIVSDENGNIIQEIDGITQGVFRHLSVSPVFRLYRLELEFADYNFDGYLDMRLPVYEGAPQYHYWLWNNEINQFIYNECLLTGEEEIWFETWWE
jgi:hypothetical protein